MPDSGPLKWKIMSLTHHPNGRTEYTPGSEPGMVDFAEWEKLGPASRLGRFIEFLAAHGYNGLSIQGRVDWAPEFYASVSQYLREQGMSLFMPRKYNEVAGVIRPHEVDYYQRPGTLWGSAWPVVRPATGQVYSQQLCPYTSETRQFWEDRVAQDVAMVPDLGGYRINATDWYFYYRGPWHCDCPTCASKSRQQRFVDGVNLIAEILARYDMMLFWRTHADDPVGQRDEVELYRDLTGKVLPNVFIVVQDQYWDYRGDDWPLHPLYDYIQTDDQGHSPYMASTQMQNQDHGASWTVYSQVERWHDLF